MLMSGERKEKRVIAVMLMVTMLAGNIAGANTLDVYGAVNGTYGAITEIPGTGTVVQGIQVPGSVKLVDKNAVPAATELYAYLQGVGESDYVLYGHQNDTHHKGGGTFEGSTNSDTKDLTGAISALCGVDSLSLTGAELSIPEGKKDSVDEAAVLAIEAAAQGGIITFSAHMPNFALVAEKGRDADGNYDYSGYSPNVTSGAVMDKILPGGELNEVYNGYLDMIARYGAILQENEIPVLFRPLHENNGNWFWWGAAYCDEESYKNVFRYTVEYLRDVKGIHNFLYVYSPNGPFDGEEDYESRYPGDEYIDIIAFDMYHDNPKHQDEWMQSFSDTVKLIEQIADKHGKIPAVSETGMRVTDSLGDGKNYGGIAPFGNPRLDWFSEIEAIVSESRSPYFMVWANFDAVDNFFTPYKVDAAHGHEMANNFIRFYNSEKSVFADGTNFYGQVSEPSVSGYGTSGYILAPVSGDRMLKAGKVRASLSERAEMVQFILRNEDQTEGITLEAEEIADFTGMKHIYTAKVTRQDLDRMGKTIGTMELRADGKSLNTIKVLYNIEEEASNPLMVDQFETYLGKTALLSKEWATNAGTNCSITPGLSEDFRSEGDYGLAFQYKISSAGGSEGWAGMTKPMEADWSGYNALQLWIHPDGKGQKLVIQLTSRGEDFEVFLPEFAATTEAKYVTVPFAAMKGKNGGTFDPSGLTSFGIWCNTIGQTAVESVMYFDDIHAVTSPAGSVAFENERLETQSAKEAAAADEEKEADRSVDPELMHLGPGYIDPKKVKEASAAVPENVTVTELFAEGCGDKYESSDVAWLMNSAPTDYITLEYTCDDASKAGWGILGWGARVDDQWVDGPTYNAEKPDPQVRSKVMISIKALRRNFGIKEGSKVESISLGGWNGGRLLNMSLTQGGTIPRSPVLLENAAADQSWECPDIEYLRDAPDNKVLNLTVTCDQPGHSQWEIMSWGAKVNGNWVDGPKYSAAKPANYEFQVSYPIAEFRQMMGMTETAKVDYLGLSVYNGGRIIRLSLDDEKQPSIAYDGPGGGSGGSSDGGSSTGKPEYTSPNESKYYDLIEKAEEGGTDVAEFDELTGTISAWGQLDAESGSAAALLKPGNFVVVKYNSADGSTIPALWPKTKDGRYRTVPAVWSDGTYAIFTYDSIASNFKNYLVPADITALSLAAAGKGQLEIQSVAVVSDKGVVITDETNVLTELYEQHELTLSDYNSEYVKGDTVTVTLTLDKNAKGYIGANIGGSWNQGEGLSGSTFTRTLKPDEGKIFVSISNFMGASYIKLKEVRVDVAGKVNYDAAVIINSPQTLAIAGGNAKDMVEAAGITEDEVNEGFQLMVNVEERELTDEIRNTIDKAPKPEGGATPVPLAVLDISLLKMNADGNSNAITSTNGKLKFVLAVPEGADTSQTFVVARIHDGQIEWLKDLDDNPDTVTIETDKFSEYVISGIEVITDQEIAENSVYRTGNLSRLSRVMEKAKNGESITIAYLGGSITNGSVASPKETNCYAYLTTEWWKKTFPDAKIHYVNAGIGATDSYLGVHRVAADVLSKNPDLVIVEFSVNDYRSHNQETYESLMRRILEHKTSPAVVDLCVTQFTEAGTCSDYSDYHKEVAEYYNLPLVSYADVVGPRLEDGTLLWTQIGPADDLTHPNNAGHKIISRCMVNFYEKVLADLNNRVYGDYSAYQMLKEPMTESRYENGRLLDHRSDVSEGISVTGSDVSKVTISEAQFPYGWQTTTGSDITFTIEDATNIGLIYYGGMEDTYGVFDVYVDDVYVNTIDTYFYGSWGSHADYKLLLTSGTAGKHTVRITKNEDSGGDVFTILGFTVSSSDAAAPAYVDVFKKEELENQSYVNHSYTLTDYLRTPATIGRDTVEVSVTLESDGDYSGAFGIGDQFTEADSNWLSEPFAGGAGEETFRFIATPMYDNFILALYSMSGERVIVKSIEVKKVSALTEANPSYLFAIEDYMAGYEAGQPVQVTVAVSAEVSAFIGSESDSTDAEEVKTGKEISRTFTPEDKTLKLTVTDFNGAEAVHIKSVSVGKPEPEGLHTFTGLYDQGPAFVTMDLGRYMEEGKTFEPGRSTTVKVILDKSAKGYIAGNVGGGWNTGDEIDGVELIRTFVPSDNYLNVYLSDMKENTRVRILSIVVEQEEEEEEPLYVFGAVWGGDPDGTYSVNLGDYMEEGAYQEGEETTISVVMDRSVTVKIAKDWGSVLGESYIIETGKTIQWTFTPDSSGIAYIQVGEVPANLMAVTVTQDSGSQTTDAEYRFTETGFYQFPISDYLPGFEQGTGSGVTIRAKFESDGDYVGNLGVWTLASGSDWTNLASDSNWAWDDSDKFKGGADDIKSDDEFDITYTGIPRYDVFDIYLTSMTGSYVDVIFIEVEYEEVDKPNVESPPKAKVDGAAGKEEEAVVKQILKEDEDELQQIS